LAETPLAAFPITEGLQASLLSSHNAASNVTL
jgi:hypothetical protein